MKFLRLDPLQVAETAALLERRIAERFPGAGLSRVAADLAGVARYAVTRAERIRRPNLWLRGGAVALVAGFVALAGLSLTAIRLRPEEPTLSDLIQDADALLASMVFMGASVIFLLGLDTRFKRRRVLQALHELRSLAHIVDMHQLTKDPEAVISGERATASSPRRSMDRFQLSRYLDYSSEMLSLIAKVAAIYVQDFPDPVAVGAVDEVEDLTNGLSRKIWQKISILDRVGGADERAGEAPGRKETA